MGFYTNYIRLCRERGISSSAAAVEIGLNKSVVTRWKSGGMPSNESLLVIAKYFDVTVEELMANGEEKEKTANPTVDGLSDYDIKMLAWFHSLAPEQRKAILTLGGAPAELAEVLDRE